jgi:large subunit ribosomal protein L32
MASIAKPCQLPAGAWGREPPDHYTHRPMAVPKQRQSHSRTNKRRSQHKITAPSLSHCPRCHAPRLPHRVCPNCGTYAGREVIIQTAGSADDE